MKQFWPGPLTLLAKNRKEETVGLRCPRNGITALLINSVGFPFWGTSANVSGQPAPATAEEVLAQLEGKIDYLIDGGPCEYGRDSTVVDVTADPPGMVRFGVEGEKIEEALEAVRTGRYPRKKILFVCTGNSCRSPMAAAWLRTELKKNRLDHQVEVDSCGVGAGGGSPSTMEAILVMKNREIDISGHRSKGCAREDVMTADLIFAMSSEHASFIQGMMPQVKDKIRLLNVPDPIGMGMLIYEQVIQSIEKKLKACWSEIIS